MQQMVWQNQYEKKELLECEPGLLTPKASALPSKPLRHCIKPKQDFWSTM